MRGDFPCLDFVSGYGPAHRNYTEAVSEFKILILLMHTASTDGRFK